MQALAAVPSWVNCASAAVTGTAGQPPQLEVLGRPQAECRLGVGAGHSCKQRAWPLSAAPRLGGPPCRRASQISCFRCPPRPLVASHRGALTSATGSPGAAGGSHGASQMRTGGEASAGRGETHRFRPPVGRCRRMRQRRGPAPLLAHGASNCQQQLNWRLLRRETSELSMVSRPPSSSPRNAEPLKACADQRRGWLPPPALCRGRVRLGSWAAHHNNSPHTAGSSGAGLRQQLCPRSTANSKASTIRIEQQLHALSFTQVVVQKQCQHFQRRAGWAGGRKCKAQ